MEFYAKYDVMTGIRIAATLGGFFIFMVFLVVYKSRSKSSKALKQMQVKLFLTIIFPTELNLIFYKINRKIQKWRLLQQL